MAAKRRLKKLDRDEQAFWDEACLTAELSVLLKIGHRIKSSQGAAHVMADFADDLLAERRLRTNKR